MRQQELLEIEGLSIGNIRDEPGKGAMLGILCIHKSTNVRLQDE